MHPRAGAGGEAEVLGLGAGLFLAQLLGRRIKQDPSWQLWAYPQWWARVLPAAEPASTPDPHDGPLLDSYQRHQLLRVGVLSHVVLQTCPIPETYQGQVWGLCPCAEVLPGSTLGRILRP